MYVLPAHQDELRVLNQDEINQIEGAGLIDIVKSAVKAADEIIHILTGGHVVLS